MRTRNALAAAALLLTACATFSDKSDYYDYREVRLSRDDSARLLAMQRYVTRHPDGRWYAEVQRERASRDRSVFEAGRSERKGLELYLAAFPDGDFAAQAKSRLAAIAVIEQRKREEAERAQRLAEERKLRDEELSRTWVTRFFGYWLKTLVELQNWGSPIEQVARGNPEFSRAFGRPPRPRCSAEECVKYYESLYAVPVPGGTRIERAMRLWLRLRLEQGKLVRAELLLPGSGFSRWQELEERRPSVDGDAEARVQALEWALGRILPQLDKLAQAPQPLSDYTLAELPKVSFGPTGELTDTTAADPGAPANRIQGGGAAAPEADVAELVKPQAPEQAPDLEMQALGVDRQGRAISAGQPAAGGEELVLEPLAVPGASGAPAPAATAPGATTPPAAGAPAAPPAAPITRAYRVGGLRLVVFESPASDVAGPDGVIIEPMGPARRGKKSASARPKPAVPGAAAPAVTPKPPAAAPPTQPAH